MVSHDLFSLILDENKKALTDIDKDEKENVFRNINFLPNLNKFGHLNKLDDEKADEV